MKVHHIEITDKKMSFARHLFVLYDIAPLLHWVRLLYAFW